MSNTTKKASERQSKIMAIIQQDLKTEGSLKNSGIETLKTTLAGVLGAGAGAALGKPSLLVGLGLMFAGHYYKSSKVVAAGTGMLVGGAYKVAGSVSGSDVSGLDGAKERLKSFGQDLKERLYLDKLKSLISKNSDSGTSGLGDVKYFNYPSNELDMGSLEAIEEEINQSAQQFEQRQGTRNVGGPLTDDDPLY